MSVNDYENNPMETEFNKLNISDRDSNVKKIVHIAINPLPKNYGVKNATHLE